MVGVIEGGLAAEGFGEGRSAAQAVVGVGALGQAEGAVLVADLAYRIVGVPGVEGLAAVGIGRLDRPPAGIVGEGVGVVVGRPDLDETTGRVVQVIGAVAVGVLDAVEQPAGAPGVAQGLVTPAVGDGGEPVGRVVGVVVGDFKLAWARAPGLGAGDLA